MDGCGLSHRVPPGQSVSAPEARAQPRRPGAHGGSRLHPPRAHGVRLQPEQLAGFNLFETKHGQVPVRCHSGVSFMRIKENLIRTS